MEKEILEKAAVLFAGNRRALARCSFIPTEHRLSSRPDAASFGGQPDDFHDGSASALDGQLTDAWLSEKSRRIHARG